VGFIYRLRHKFLHGLPGWVRCWMFFLVCNNIYVMPDDAIEDTETDINVE
jgi:hypothetical protein